MPGMGEGLPGWKVLQNPPCAAHPEVCCPRIRWGRAGQGRAGLRIGQFLLRAWMRLPPSPRWEGRTMSGICPKEVPVGIRRTAQAGVSD